MDDLSNGILMDNYIIIKKIGSGSFGEVYISYDKKKKIFMAAKFEDKKKQHRVQIEFNIYKNLRKNGFKYGLPKIYSYIQTIDYNIMFMQLLGPSLEELFTMHSRQFKLSTIFYLANQLILLLQTLHNTNYIHRDIKPNNFLIGNNLEIGQLFMMDFGLSKKYTNTDNSHIKYKTGKSLIGTARYASINMHNGIDPTRRDDLESIGYMLIYFAKGKLPWQGIKKDKQDKQLQLDTIGNIKKSISIEQLCDSLPDCFSKYLYYCRNLKFDETPDYNYILKLLNNSCVQYNITPDFEWGDITDI
jgi:casein kinase 1